MPQRALGLCLATIAVLVAMLVVTAVTGATQEAHEYCVHPGDFMAALHQHAGATRLLFALDTAFLILYTLLFAAIHEVLAATGAPRMFLRLALAAILAAAALDLVENFHILAMLDLADHDIPPSDTQMAFQQVVSGTKFAASTLGLVAFGICIPRDRLIAWILAGFLTIGTLVTTVLNTAAPPDMRPSLDQNRWFGFLIGFVIAGLWLRTRCKPPRASAALTE